MSTAPRDCVRLRPAPPDARWKILGIACGESIKETKKAQLLRLKHTCIHCESARRSCHGRPRALEGASRTAHANVRGLRHVLRDGLCPACIARMIRGAARSYADPPSSFHRYRIPPRPVLALLALRSAQPPSRSSAASSVCRGAWATEAGGSFLRSCPSLPAPPSREAG